MFEKAVIETIKELYETRLGDIKLIQIISALDVKNIREKICDRGVAEDLVAIFINIENELNKIHNILASNQSKEQVTPT